MNRVAHLRQQAAPPPDTRWRAARLLTAPHRLGFFAAALMLAASALWWAAALFARQLGLALPWAVPPPVAHALVMTAGFMPLFIVGFLFTAGPRWLGLPEVSAHTLKWPVSAMLGGWALALAGFHLQPLLAGLGVAAAATGWSVVAWRFVVLCRRSTAADRLHAGVVAAAGAIGALALWSAAAGLLAGDITWVRVATQVALWAWLAPTFAAVSHRMIPFFTASALPMLDSWRPNWLLGVMVAALAASAAGVVAELLWWPVPAPLHGVLAAVQAPAAALMLWLAWRWGLVQSLKIRLLAMLHGGFVWLGVALALAALSHTQLALGRTGLGLAPTHALAMGYLGATLLAMITRVASGHSGRPLAADNLAWGLYWAVQVATLLRVGATLWPAADVTLLLGAVFGWAVAAVGWAWRYGGWLGRPRVDGRPG